MSHVVGLLDKPVRVLLPLCPQGVLVGHDHPVMYFTGQLPAEVHMLQATCPPNCVHVSARIVESVGETWAGMPQGR
jgi:hypothetical protein